MREAYVGSLIVCLMWFVSSPAPVDGQKKADVDRDVLVAIEKDYPGAVIPKYLSAESCFYVKTDHPGWVVADFNGDGLSDHAVLLHVQSKEEAHPGLGQGWDFNLVVVWQVKAGVYRTELVSRIWEGITSRPPDFSPRTIKERMTTWIYIEKQPPGKIEDIGDIPESGAVGDGTVVMQNPGIHLHFCEKSSLVYYWDKKANRFGELVTSH